MTSKRKAERPRTASGRDYLKMKELAEAADLPATTIQHYVEQGLLPRPVKTSRNMAYYHPDFIDRIRTIKRLREEHQFSLDVIAKLMKEKEMGLDLEPLIELRELLFSPSKSRRFTRHQFLKATGLKEKQLDAALNAGLLIRLSDRGFDSEDVAAGVVLGSFLGMGMSIDELGFYPALLDQVVSREMSIREQLTDSLAYQEDAAITAELTANSRKMTFYIHDRLLQRRALARKGLKDRGGRG